MRISLVSLGQTGAGPVYSLEMAKALALKEGCDLQVIISENITNRNAWDKAFINSNVDYHVIKTYNHNALSVLLSCFNINRQERLVGLIKGFGADVLYLPFGLMWSRYVLWRLHKNLKIIKTLHDVEFHDSFKNLSIAELGYFIINYGSDKYCDGTIILNKKDKLIVEERTNKPVAVIPHASFSYYFDDKRLIDYSIKKRIGFFGRIEKYKGLDLLVDAFEMCNVEGLKLLVAGSGNIEDNLYKRIASNNNINLINRYIEDEEFQTLLDTVDFVVLPYKRASQSGVIPMCFAAGRTVVSTNVGALSEQVPEGTGLIVGPDVDNLTNAISYLYDNQELINTFSRNAKGYADKELSWDYSAELLISFARSLVYEYPHND